MQLHFCLSLLCCHSPLPKTQTSTTVQPALDPLSPPKRQQDIRTGEQSNENERNERYRRRSETRAAVEGAYTAAYSSTKLCEALLQAEPRAIVLSRLRDSMGGGPSSRVQGGGEGILDLRGARAAEGGSRHLGEMGDAEGGSDFACAGEGVLADGAGFGGSGNGFDSVLDQARGVELPTSTNRSSDAGSDGRGIGRQIDPFAYRYREDYERRIREKQRKWRCGVHLPARPPSPCPKPRAEASRFDLAHLQHTPGRPGAPFEVHSHIQGATSEDSLTNLTPSAHQKPLRNLPSVATLLTPRATPESVSDPNDDQTWHELHFRNFNLITAARHDLATSSTTSIPTARRNLQPNRLSAPPRLAPLDFLRTPRSTPPIPPTIDTPNPTTTPTPASPSSSGRSLNLHEFLASTLTPTPRSHTQSTPISAGASTPAASTLHRRSGAKPPKPKAKPKPLPHLPKSRGYGLLAALDRQAEALIATSGGRGMMFGGPRGQGGSGKSGGDAFSAVCVGGSGSGRVGQASKRLSSPENGEGGSDGGGGSTFAGSNLDDQTGTGDEDGDATGVVVDGAGEAAGKRPDVELAVESWWGLQVLDALDEVRAGIGTVSRIGELERSGWLGVSGKWRRESLVR